MARTGPAGDDRGVSEGLSVAILLLMAFLVTASVGVSVLFIDQDGPNPAYNFTYNYYDGSARLVIAFEEGEELAAGEVLVAGPDNNVTWAALASANRTATIDPGDAVQVSQQGAYGNDVQSNDRFLVVHAPDTGNRTVLSERDP